MFDDYLQEYWEIKKTHKETRTRKRQFIEKLKETTPCVDCKQYYPPYALDFDHISGVKVDNIRTIARKGTMEELELELTKVVVRCKICHARRTWKRSKGLTDEY